MAITKIIVSKTARVDLGNRAGIEPGVTVEVSPEPHQTAAEALAEGVAFVNNALLDQLAVALERMPEKRLMNWYELLGCPPPDEMYPAKPKHTIFDPTHRGMRPAAPLHIVERERALSTAITFVDDPDYIPAPDDDEEDTRDGSDVPPVELEELDERRGFDDDELDIHRAEGEGMGAFVWNADMYVYTLRALAKEHGEAMPYFLKREAAIAHMREFFPECEQTAEAASA